MNNGETIEITLDETEIEADIKVAVYNHLTSIFKIAGNEMYDLMNKASVFEVAARAAFDLIAAKGLFNEVDEIKVDDKDE